MTVLLAPVAAFATESGAMLAAARVAANSGVLPVVARLAPPQRGHRWGLVVTVTELPAARRALALFPEYDSAVLA